jgi:heat shock protein HtpX
MAFRAVGLKTAIWNNNIRSIILIALYPLTITVMVWCVAALVGMTGSYGRGAYEFYDYSECGGEYVEDTDEDGNEILVYESDCEDTGESYRADWQTMLAEGAETANAFALQYWPAIFGVVFGWFLISAAFHTRMVRMLSHAHPVNRTQEPELYNLVENLCISRGLPVPRLEVIETDARNAFASGIDDTSYTIAVTRGLLQSLQKDEVEAVLAHELTHIMNNDVRLLIITVIFTGMVGFICQMFWTVARGALGGRGEKDVRFVMLVLAVGAILGIGYCATLLTRFALSRRREYMADAGAVELTKNPEALMRALIRISGADRIPQATEDVALMCIENSHPFFGLFSTHPRMDKRLRAISEMTQTPIPGLMPGQQAMSGFERAPLKASGSRLPWQ